MLHDRTIQLGGQRFHYTETGDPAAAPVILLHGVTGHARTWDDEARLLAPRYRVLALDQRGHGDTAAPPDGDYTVAALAADLAAFTDALGLQAIRLVGLSMGGRVAIAFGARRPERVARLVVVDIGPEVAADGVARVGALMAKAPEHFDDLESVVAWMRAANPRYVEAMLRHRAEHATRPGPSGGRVWKYDRGLREAVRAGRWRDPVDLWPLWRALACPTLLVRGAESDVLSPELAKRMLEENPAVRFVEVPGAGHTVPGDRPATFQALLVEFLGG